MDRATILTIVGLIATVALGSFSIYLVLRRRYPGRITFIKESSIGLFDSIVKNLPDLSVLYKDEPVNENLVLLKGILHNTGSIDITEAMIKKALAIKLPEGYRWRAHKIVSSSSEVQADIKKVNPTTLEFEIGLFRCDEHIRFEALAEVPIQQDSSEQRVEDAGVRLTRALIISHRIAETRKVAIEDMSSFGHTLQTRLRMLALTLTIALSIGLAAFFIWPEPKRDVTYLMRDPNGKEIEVTIDFTAPGSKIDVKGVSGDYHEQLLANELRRRGYTVAPDQGRFSSFILPFTLMVIATPAALLLSSFYISKKRKTKLKNFLASA
jgi:hypothetical protein